MRAVPTARTTVVGRALLLSLVAPTVSAVAWWAGSATEFMFVILLPLDYRSFALMIARPMISGICGTTALPRVRRRCARLEIP